MKQHEFKFYACQQGVDERHFAYTIEDVETGWAWVHDLLDGTTTPYPSMEQVRAALGDDVTVEEIASEKLSEHARDRLKGGMTKYVKVVYAAAVECGASPAMFGGNHASGVIGTLSQIANIDGGLHLGNPPR